MIMGKKIDRIQFRAKKSPTGLSVYFLRVVTGGWIGIVFAHFFHGFFGFETFLLSLVVLVITCMIVFLTKRLGFFLLVIFNLLCVLSGVLLQMYVKLAPWV